MATPDRRDKRGRPFNHYGGGGSHNSHSHPHHHHPSKKHKPNDTSAPSRDKPLPVVPTNGRYARELLENAIGGLPEPAHCQPCQLSTAERQSGILALLDHLVYDEAGAGTGTIDNADKEILHHARQLRQLLAARARGALPSAPKQELDRKNPATGDNIIVPAYVHRRLELAKATPPLPPISEPYLENAVFTHTSANTTTVPRRLNSDQPDQISYERLEFLGDAYIELLATRIIYTRFPHMDVARQSQLRELLVRNETLQVYSEAYGFPDRLKHGGHINLGSQKTWVKVQADIFEAYVGALVMSDPDNGFAAAEAWLTELWAPHILGFKEAPVENARARDELNKLIMAKGIKLDYRMEKPMDMIDGIQRFYMAVYLTGWGYENQFLGRGAGQNKSQACILAAMDALENSKVVIGEANRKKLELYPPAPKVDHGEKGAENGGENREEGGKQLVEDDRKDSAANVNVMEVDPEERKEKKRRRKEKKDKGREDKAKVVATNDGTP